MRVGRVSDALVVGWLDELAATTTHLSLVTQDPFTVADPLTVEPAGGVYSRAPVTWTRSGTVLRNAILLVWAGLPAGINIVGIAGFTAAFNGAPTLYHPVGPLAYPQGGGLTIPAEELFFRIGA